MKIKIKTILSNAYHIILLELILYFGIQRVECLKCEVDMDLGTAGIIVGGFILAMFLFMMRLP